MNPSVKYPAVLANCTGCGRCVAACPQRALSLETELPNGLGRKLAVLTPRLCTGCGECFPACPHQALRIDPA